MADQRAAGWNFDVLGDDLPVIGNDNVQRATPTDAYVAKNIDQLQRSLIAGGRHVGESHECVALVKHAIPEIGRAANWAEGTKINGYNDPPLEPGTALATFKHGKYQNDTSGNHAVLFLEFGENAQGQQGFYVLDQSRNQVPDKRFIRFDGSTTQNPSNYAGNYSVIRRPPAR